MYNGRHQLRLGISSQGQSKAILVKKSALLELCRNVVLTPVRTKMVMQIGSHTGNTPLE
jgi:hypothetical protein